MIKYKENYNKALNKVNNYQNKVLNYFQSCGWTTEKTSQDKDGSFVKISNGPESYFSYIFDDEKSADYKATMRKMSELQNDSQKTKTTILFSSEFTGDMDNADEFSTVLVDNKEIDYLLENQQKNSGYQHIQLQAHNHIAFKKYLENPTNKSAFVNATGTGKSYLIAKVAQHNYPKKIGIMSSSSFILDQQEKLIGDISNLSYMTYAKGGVDYDNKDFTEDLDVLIMDEFHRAGAENWGAGVQNIIDSNKDLELVGLSATHIRHLDNKRNMADELFDGNVISSLPLTTAIAKQILPMPKYVSGIYDIGDTTDSYKERINSSAMSDDKKQESLDTLNGLALDWNKFSNASTILADNLETYDGKYIVFCESIDHMKVMKEKMSEWIKDAYQEKHGKAFTSAINITEMHSKKTPLENNKTLESFDKVGANDGLNLLFTVDMLNEGKHVKGISGAFLLRRTTSPILYYQQMGRAFAASDNYSPLIIDMVGNINTIHSNIFSEDLAEKIAKEKEIQDSLEPGFELPQLDISGKIISYNDDIVGKLEELDSMLSHSKISFDNNYQLLKEYYEEYGNLDISQNDVYQKKKIGRIISDLRVSYKTNRLSSDKIENLEAIGFKWSVDLSTFDKAYPLLQSYYKEHKNINILKKDTYKEKPLGNMVGTLRQDYKKGKLTSEQIENLEIMDFKWVASKKSTFDNAYPILQDYYKEHGNLNVSISDIYQEKPLGRMISTLRTDHKNGKLKEEQIKKLKEIDFRFNPFEDAFNKNYELLKKYYEIHGDLNIKLNDTFEGQPIGGIINTFRDSYRSNKLSKEKIGKLEEIDFIFNAKIDFFSKNMPVLREYFEDYGNLDIKLADIYKDNKIGNIVGELRGYFHKGKIKDNIIKELEDMGFKWSNKKVSRFESNYPLLKEYFEEKGNLNLKSDEVYKGKNIGRVIVKLKDDNKNGKLSHHDIKTLEDMGCNLSGRKSIFENAYPLLQSYHKEYGNLDIKQEDTYQEKFIGVMVNNLRKEYKNNKLTLDKISKLEAMDFNFGKPKKPENINELKDTRDPDKENKGIEPKEILAHLKADKEVVKKALMDKVREKNSEPVM